MLQVQIQAVPLNFFPPLNVIVTNTNITPYWKQEKEFMKIMWNQNKSYANQKLKE